MKIKRTKPTGDLRRFLDAKKTDTVVLGPVERHLLKRAEGDRRQDILHPSEMCKTDLCDLAVYYRVLGRKPVRENRESKPSFQLQRIFDEGHTVHAKWQGYLTEARMLEGIWQCPSCNHRWWDNSPVACARCNHVGQNTGRFTNMVYREVPFDAEESHLIQGHADGKVGRHILEIKTLGVGTLRMEAAGLLATHTYRVETDAGEKSIVDLDGLWKGVKRPLNVHQRQAHLYVALAQMQGIEVDSVVFLYECKWNQSSKEFVVPYNPRMAEPLLEKALDLKYAIEKQRPPRCPHGGCDECARYTDPDYDEEHDRAEGDETDQESRGGDRGGERERAVEAGEAGPDAAPPADGSDPARARQPLGARRQPADGALRAAHGVGRVPLGAARVRGDRRASG